MTRKIIRNGIAIALAWPETYCKQAGAWYDFIAHTIGLSHNHHYKVGHAAVILVNGECGNCNYFDFGRYHAPFKHGRVRNEHTDTDLNFRTKAVISDTYRITNLHQILGELYENQATHGTGPVYASYTGINFDLAYTKAKMMMEMSPWKYGPFLWNGTNCSRFVRSVIQAGRPKWRFRVKLFLPLSLTPTPLSNVNALGKSYVFPYLKRTNNRLENESTVLVQNVPILKSTMPPPRKSSGIPSNAHWLAGEGAGSWFLIEKHEEDFTVIRFSPAGEIECKGLFKVEDGQHIPDLGSPFELQHISHCNQIKIRQHGNLITLQKIISQAQKIKDGVYSNISV